MRPDNNKLRSLDRRTALKVLGGSALSAALFGGSASAQATRYEMRWGEGVDVTGGGDIDLQTNAQVCTTSDFEDGTPIFLGIWMNREGFEAFTSGEAQGGHEHPTGGVSYNLDLPEVSGLPFTFTRIDWGPQGHPPAPWQFPHFDLHFYLIDEETVMDIEGGIAQYDIPDERMPEGYVTAEALGGPREVIPGMGEHLVDPTTPELGGEQFTHTLIWGSYDVDGDGVGDSIFVEPMITADFIANLDGWVRAPVALPRVVPKSGYYPTEYSIRHYEEHDSFLVTLQNFEWRDA